MADVTELEAILASMRGEPRSVTNVPSNQSLHILDAYSVLVGCSESCRMTARWLSCFPDGLYLEVESKLVQSNVKVAHLLWHPALLMLLDGESVPLHFAVNQG